MPERHCATEGCLGTLPAGKGTHCPRCGGTEFLPPRGKWGKFAVVALLGVVIIAAALARSGRKSSGISASPERDALVEAHDVASRMSISTTRDGAYADIVIRALAARDYEYACQVGSEMSNTNIRDKALMAVVEESLKANQRDWAKKATESMSQANERDAALRRIMLAGQGNEADACQTTR